MPERLRELTGAEAEWRVDGIRFVNMRWDLCKDLAAYRSGLWNPANARSGPTPLSDRKVPPNQRNAELPNFPDPRFSALAHGAGDKISANLAELIEMVQYFYLLQNLITTTVHGHLWQGRELDWIARHW